MAPIEVHRRLVVWAEGPQAREVIASYLHYCLGPNPTRSFLRDEGVEAFTPSAHGLENVGKARGPAEPSTPYQP